ncbi:hypothetical protein QQF09_07605 [Clostridium perfringens]|uniref:hypothetical protein n=1 Tax=Clostridium perfringens TaxID=1502 RepID=UPI001CC9C770|nr:hypothetical protein [Clostridium perfringens]UBK36189.1 hypothetical protein KLF25_07275 [Clostridium perfringens]
MFEEAKILLNIYSIIIVIVLLIKNLRHLGKKDSDKRSLELAALIPIFIYLTNIY